MDQVHRKMSRVCVIFSELTHPMGPSRHNQQTTTHFFCLNGNAGQPRHGRVSVHKNGSLIPIHRVRVYPISDPFRIRVSQPSKYCKMNYVQGVFNKFLKYHAKILSRSSVSENTVFQDGIFERQSAYSPQSLSDCNNTQHSQDSAVTRLRSGKRFASRRGEVLLQSDRTKS